MWKKVAKDYFTFSKKDRIAISILITLFGSTILLPRIFPSAMRSEKANSEELIQQFRELSSMTEDSSVFPNKERKSSTYHPEKIVTGKLFHFDPNTISVEDWIQLGVGEKTAATIQKYISKGGKFKEPKDLLKIYTLRKEVAERLIPYVRIPKQQETGFNNNQENFKKETYPAGYKDFTFKKVYQVVEINSADTSLFKTFPGIGSRLASRIVRRREALGGFVSVDQIAETKYLHDTVFQKIRPFLKLENPGIKKLNINSATLEELLKHPYFEPVSANAIIQYRSQHGAFTSINDLQRLHAISEDFLKKIEPYLAVK